MIQPKHWLLKVVQITQVAAPMRLSMMVYTMLLKLLLVLQQPASALKNMLILFQTLMLALVFSIPKA